MSLKCFFQIYSFANLFLIRGLFLVPINLFFLQKLFYVGKNSLTNLKKNSYTKAKKTRLLTTSFNENMFEYKVSKRLLTHSELSSDDSTPNTLTH